MDAKENARKAHKKPAQKPVAKTSGRKAGKTFLYRLLGALPFFGRRKRDKSLKKDAKKTRKEPKPKKPKVKISKAAKKPSNEKLSNELKTWKRKVERLTIKIERLEKQLKKREINPKNAKNTIKVVYSKLDAENKNISTDLKYTHALMKRLEGEYFKRHLTESEFRQKMLNYREKLYLLKLKKKEVQKQKRSTDQVSEMIQHAIILPHATGGSVAGKGGIQPVQLVQPIPGVGQTQSSKPRKASQVRQAGRIIKTVAVEEKEVVVKGQKVKPVAKSIPKTSGAKFVEVPVEESSEQAPTKPIKQTHPQAGKQARKQILKEPKTKIVHNIIEHRAKGKIDKQKLEQLESKVGDLSKKYNIPAEDIEKEIKGSDTKTLLKSFNRMISLLELEHKAKLAEKGIEEESTVKDLARYGVSKEIKKEIQGVAVELKKHRIITDFDRILSLVHSEGRVKIGQVSKKEKIDRGRVMECAEILEDSGLVNIVYPTIGDPFIQLKDYIPQKTKTKKVNKNAR